MPEGRAEERRHDCRATETWYSAVSMLRKVGLMDWCAPSSRPKCTKGSRCTACKRDGGSQAQQLLYSIPRSPTVKRLRSLPGDVAEAHQSVSAEAPSQGQPCQPHTRSSARASMHGSRARARPHPPQPGRRGAQAGDPASEAPALPRRRSRPAAPQSLQPPCRLAAVHRVAAARRARATPCGAQSSTLALHGSRRRCGRR